MDTFELHDRVPLSGMKRDGAGNLVVPATVARTGIYEYAGFEVGRPDQRVVRVYRSPDEVFSRDSMRSLAGVPVTIRHPTELVTTDNWGEHAKGETASDDIVRDGDTIKVPFLVRDAGAITAVEDGLHELSPGYTAVIDFTAGQTERGEAYDAVARNIRYNHLAIVDKARGGSECRIGDTEPGDKKVETKLILVDGFSVETIPASETAILKLVDERNALKTELADAKAATAAAEAAKATLDGEKAALTQQLKDATDPAALQKAATDRSKLCDQAKAIVPKIVTDGKTDAEIRKEVVTAKLGDAAAALSDDGIAGAFTTLAATVKVKDSGGRDALREAIAEGGTDETSMATLLENRDKARQGMFDHLHDGHKPVAAKE